MYLDHPSVRYTEQNEPTHTYTFTGPCIVTSKLHSVTIPAAQLFLIRRGLHIQDACPQMPDGDREFLITGISPEGWSQVFGDDPDDDSDHEGGINFNNET